VGIKWSMPQLGYDIRDPIANQLIIINDQNSRHQVCAHSGFLILSDATVRFKLS
jgi:hypothetical protein